jgi:hypothetical protein
MNSIKIEESHTQKLLECMINRPLNFSNPNTSSVFIILKQAQLSLVLTKMIFTLQVKNLQNLALLAQFTVHTVMLLQELSIKFRFSSLSHIHYLHSPKLQETFTYPTGAPSLLMSTSTFSTSVQVLMDNFQELTTCHMLTHLMVPMLLALWL